MVLPHSCGVNTPIMAQVKLDINQNIWFCVASKSWPVSQTPGWGGAGEGSP